MTVFSRESLTGVVRLIGATLLEKNGQWSLNRRCLQFEGPQAGRGCNERTVTKPFLHGDNGATLKATTVVAMLNWLGVRPSYSRPRVSDDNAYAESLFRTAKYRPEFPAKGFSDLDAARGWAAGFVRWYNHDHRHSGIGYVSPAQRHSGEDRIILAARHALYLQARALKPARWSGKTRNWAPIGAVTLNPERDCVIKAHLEKAIQPMAA